MSLADASRTFALVTALGAAVLPAHALTIDTSGLVATSTLQFSPDVQDQFEVLSVAVRPLGNAAGGAAAGEYVLPVTSISIDGRLAIAGGAATGSALEFSRPYGASQTKLALTLANFTINYQTRQVLADVTPLGGSALAQTPIYNFNVASPLGLQYKFPLTVYGHEVLDQLFLTPTAIQNIYTALKLPSFTLELLKATDFGTLTQDVKVALRKPVSTAPYTPGP